MYMVRHSAFPDIHMLLATADTDIRNSSQLPAIWYRWARPLRPDK